MELKSYAALHRNGHNNYHVEFSISDPYDDELVKSYDDMLHQTLSKIFRERCLSSGQIKELLRASEHTTKDQDSVIKLILEREPALSEIFPNENKLSLLWIAVLWYYQKSAELLVRSDADVNERCKTNLYGFLPDEKWTILHRILTMYPSSWNERFIALVMDHGADLEARDSHNWTVLHMAAREGRINMAKVFLEKGLDVNAAAINGLTPLLAATHSEADAAVADEMMLLLLQHGADATVRNVDGANALHYLACAGVERLYQAEVLIKKGVSLDDRVASNQYQPLHLAVRDGKLGLIKYFLLALHKARMPPLNESKDERRIEEASKHWNYYQNCFEELDEMKSTKFIETCTFFELITKCSCQIAELMRNREFESKFKQHDLNVFSNYAEDMLAAIALW